MKKLFSSMMLAPVVLVTIILSLANFQELPQGYTAAPGEPTCNTTCHNNPIPEMKGGIVVQGLPQYVVGGQPYLISYKIYTENEWTKTAGFQMTFLNNNGTSNGTLEAVGSNVKTLNAGIRQYVQHGPAIVFNEGSVGSEYDFVFNWTPEPVVTSTPVTAYTAAILGNGNYMSTSGGFRLDSTLLAQFNVVVIPQADGQIVETQRISCFGESDGALTIDYSGSGNPYTVLWSNGETTETISGLSAGTYSVTVSEVTGQSLELTYELMQPFPLQMDASLTDPSCFEGQDGSMDVDVSGGTPPYQYFLNGSSTSNPVTGLGSGIYTLDITDSNGCNIDAQFELSSPDAIDIQILELTHETAEQGGEIIIDVQGGTPPYSYFWEAVNIAYNSTVQNPSNLEADIYNLTVTDANGCEAVLSVEIENLSSVANADPALRLIALSPNPGMESLYLSLPESMINHWEVTVYTLNGKKVWGETIREKTSAVCHLAASWDAGSYLVQFRHISTGGVRVLKWVKI